MVCIITEVFKHKFKFNKYYFEVQRIKQKDYSTSQKQQKYFLLKQNN